MDEDDALLVERARRGDAGGWEQLVRRYLRPAYAVALGVVGEPADAEDVAQEALLVALERLDQCRRPERFAAWLLRIVRTRALNHRRATAARRADPLERASGVADPGDPARDAERGELRERLRGGLAALKPDERDVVLLHDLEGWRHREIAATLGIAEGTSRSHLFRARRALRSFLGTAHREEG